MKLIMPLSAVIVCIFLFIACTAETIEARVIFSIGACAFGSVIGMFGAMALTSTDYKSIKKEVGPQRVTVDDMSYVVRKSSWHSDLNCGWDKPNAMFLVVDISVRNDYDRPKLIPNIKLVYGGCIKCEISSTDNTFSNYQLCPGVEMRGFIVFDVPKNKKYRLQVPEVHPPYRNETIELVPTRIPFFLQYVINLSRQILFMKGKVSIYG